MCRVASSTGGRPLTVGPLRWTLASLWQAMRGATAVAEGGAQNDKRRVAGPWLPLLDPSSFDALRPMIHPQH